MVLHDISSVENNQNSRGKTVSVCGQLTMNEIFNTIGLNPLTASVALIQKPVN